jgi:hypothetical protein
MRCYAAFIAATSFFKNQTPQQVQGDRGGMTRAGLLRFARNSYYPFVIYT